MTNRRVRQSLLRTPRYRRGVLKEPWTELDPSLPQPEGEGVTV
jgi:hypothetical protein